MKILIAGDSFAAQWPNGEEGWPYLLAVEHDVTNVAQAGVSEYKIYKQILAANVNSYDCVIVSHTSPNRVHTPKHPIHKEGLHKNCDLIYNDLSSRFSWFNRSLDVAKGWFEFHYDQEYQNDVYRLLRKEINETIKVPYINLNNLEVSKEFMIEDIGIDFSPLWAKERGVVNHYSTKGNLTIFNIIKRELDTISKKDV
jgi:hypothetical protein